MFNMRFSGVMKFPRHTHPVDSCAYTRRPYQLFQPVLRDDMSGCVSDKRVGALAISICAARPIPLPGQCRDLDWDTRMRFEGFCKNAFWLISDLYKRTDIAEQQIPVFISTNQSGHEKVLQYARACKYPESQIIVHPDEPPPTKRDLPLPNAIKFDALAHERLSKFMRVLHIDTGERVPHPCFGIWKDTLASWPAGTDIVNGKAVSFTRARVPIELIESKLRKATGITDLPGLRDAFFSRKSWPQLYAPCFGGSPHFWRNDRLRDILRRANQVLYGDGLMFVYAAIALGIEDHQVLSFPNLTKHMLYHMEPLQLEAGTAREYASDQEVAIEALSREMQKLSRFFDSVQVCLNLHREDFDMSIWLDRE